MHRVILDPAAVSQYWLYWVKTLFPIINFPVYFQYYLPLLFPFKSLFYTLGLTKLALTNQNLQEEGWESVLFITSVFQWSDKSGKSFYRTTELLSIHHKCPLCIPLVFCQHCASSFYGGDIYLPICQDPVKIPPDFTTTALAYIYFLSPLLDYVILEIRKGVWFISSLTQHIFMECLPYARHFSGHWLYSNEQKLKTKFTISMDILVQAWANCGSQIKSDSLHVFVKKCYWNTATIFLHVVYSRVECFTYSLIEWVPSSETIWATKAKIFTICPFTEKLADPCSGISLLHSTVTDSEQVINI